jgi:hypothetical protein
VGIATYFVSKVFLEKEIKPRYVLLLFLSFFIIFSVKKYILISFLAAVFVWIASIYFFKIESKVKRILFVPVVILITGSLAYFSISRVVADDTRYSFGRIAETARITAFDIQYGWGSGSGSGYSLGTLDGSIGTMIKLAPEAINVSMFRPYVWEVKSPIMFLSAFESLLTLLITLYVLLVVRWSVFKNLKGDVIFCLLFALVFAFGVGISTYNFGSLARYKIPLLPFYFTGIGLIYHYWKREKKVPVLDLTE